MIAVLCLLLLWQPPGSKGAETLLPLLAGCPPLMLPARPRHGQWRERGLKGRTHIFLGVQSYRGCLCLAHTQAVGLQGRGVHPYRKMCLTRAGGRVQVQQCLGAPVGAVGSQERLLALWGGRSLSSLAPVHRSHLLPFSADRGRSAGRDEVARILRVELPGPPVRTRWRGRGCVVMEEGGHSPTDTGSSGCQAPASPSFGQRV